METESIRREKYRVRESVRARERERGRDREREREMGGREGERGKAETGNV